MSSISLEERVHQRVNEAMSQSDSVGTPFRDRMRVFELTFQKTLKQEVRSAMQVITRTEGPHEDWIWQAAAMWTLDAIDEPKRSEFLVPYLGCFGYEVEDESRWKVVPGSDPSCPVLTLVLVPSEGSPAHEEHCGHTWYNVDCEVSGIPTGTAPREGHVPFLGAASMQVFKVYGNKVAWKSPRRLLQLRECLHAPVKAALGAEYPTHFSETPFAKKGGFSGTTARLGAWLAKLAEVINAGKLSPALVARTMVFFRGPPQVTPQEAEDVAATADPEEQPVAPPVIVDHSAGLPIPARYALRAPPPEPKGPRNVDAADPGGAPSTGPFMPEEDEEEEECPEGEGGEGYEEDYAEVVDEGAAAAVPIFGGGGGDGDGEPEVADEARDGKVSEVLPPRRKIQDSL